MLQPNSSLAIYQLPALSAQLGVPLPKPVVAALDAIRNVPDLGRQPSVREVADAALDAVKRGTDPASDPDVQRLTTARALAGMNITNAAHEYAAHHADAVIRQYAAAIASSWAPVAAADGEALTHAVAVLPAHVGLSGPAHITTLSPAGVAAWAAARAARARLIEVLKGWRLLDHLGRFARHNPHRLLLAVAPLNLEQFETVGKLDVWGAARHGVTLTLADGDEYRRRSEQLDAEVAARDTTRQRGHHAVSGFTPPSAA